MKNNLLKSMCVCLFLGISSSSSAQVATPTHQITQPFSISQPDYTLSPYTGLTRQGWIDAAKYLLEGAFTYVRSMDDPMYFPKQHEKTYPNNDGQVPTAKLEGFCRTLFIAAPLLREEPDLTMNGIKVADYYRHQLLNLINPNSASYIKHRTGGPSQILVEFGALAISLTVAKDVLWTPLTQEQKDELAATMLSYGNGPTIGSNWMFFNVFVISFFKEQGYAVNEGRLKENLQNILKLYRGEGWYNDAPAYDYYSMWAFQMYGPIWAKFYGHEYPEYAEQLMKNQGDLVDNYPYMFSAGGKMNMWGRSIPYRFGAVVPLALLGFREDPTINYGWMRRIASATLLQFIQHPDFLEDNVPTLGFYGPFEQAVQIYSCRGSVYWCGKAFLSLILPADNPFWTAKENNGPWEKEFKKHQVYNKFQPATNLLITDYPDCGGAEMRSWCHETVAGDWQKFRSTENYNKLAYHTEFPWMADGADGEVSMNYATLNDKGQWEVLRLYDFVSYNDGLYRRNAELETNHDVKYQLAEIPLPGGVLHIAKVKVPHPTEIRLGHYSLPQIGDTPIQNGICKHKKDARYITNGKYSLALVPVLGWDSTSVAHTTGLHPEHNNSSVIMAHRTVKDEAVVATLMLWKKGSKAFTRRELNPIVNVVYNEEKDNVAVVYDKSFMKLIEFK